MPQAKLAHPEERFGIPEVRLEIEGAVEFFGGPRIILFRKGNRSQIRMR